MGLGLRGRVILRLCWPDGACSGESVAAGIKPRMAVSHCQAAVGSVTPGGPAALFVGGRATGIDRGVS
jgi:hypothetical protein